MYATQKRRPATVEGHLGVLVNQNRVGGLSLAGVAGHGIAMIEIESLRE